jgi:hypothetical protein
VSIVLSIVCLQAGLRAHAEPPRVGYGPSALPAVDRVGFVGDCDRGFAAVAGTGYGFTEAVLGQGESHHRVPGRLGASVAPMDWLAFALRADGRLDLQSGGADAGARFLGESRAFARAQGAVGTDLALGAELGLLFPGATSPGDGLAATTPEARLLLTGAVLPALAVSGLVGFRVDRSDEAVDVLSLTRADRLGLGASESNAVLLGAAVSYRQGRVDWLGEWTWDVLVGSRAPGAFESPMRLEAGFRYWPTETLHFEAMLGASPSARPSLAASARLAPIEPRVWANVAVGLAFPFAKPAPPPTPASPPPAAPPSAALVTGGVQGRVLDEAGAPVAGAEVAVVSVTDGLTHAPEPVARATTDAEGRYGMPGLAPGAYELTVRAKGRPERAQRIEVPSGAPLVLDLPLNAKLPEGQIRGTVRLFDGKPLAARVRIEPGGVELRADADGRFTADVPPGDYTVQVSAPAHGEQERAAHVEENGVTVIIVDLGKEK